MSKKKTFDLTGYISDTFIPNLEAEHNVEVLFAIESGSRMWGFPSPDSDYDIRFIYRRRDFRDGVSVSKTLDTIEQNDPNPLIDATGWDIVKAVNLMRTGNGSVIDWLGSPIVYASKPLPTAHIRMLQSYLLSFEYVRRRFVYHHRGLVHKSHTEALKKAHGDGSNLSAKKMLYATRSALMLKKYLNIMSEPWLLPNPTIDGLIGRGRNNGLVSDTIFDQICSLIEKKATTAEKAAVMSPREYPELYEFISDMLMKSVPDGRSDSVDLDACDAVIRAIL